MRPQPRAASRKILAAKLLTAVGLCTSPLHAQTSGQEPTQFVPNQSGINSLQGTNTPGVNAPINPNQNANNQNRPDNANGRNNRNAPENAGNPAGGISTGGFRNGFFNGGIGANGALDNSQALALLIVIHEQQLAQLAQLAVQQSTNDDVKAFAQAQLNATQQILAQLGGGTGIGSNTGVGQDPLEGRNNTRNARNPQRQPREPLAEPHTNSGGNTASNNTGNNAAPNNTNVGGNQVVPFGSNGVGMRNQLANQAGSFDLLSLQQQIAQETSSSLQRLLQGQSDNAFDLAFVHFTIVELSQTLATMQAIAQNGGVSNNFNQNGNALNDVTPNDGNPRSQDGANENPPAPNANPNDATSQNATQAGIGQPGAGNLQGVLNAAMQQTQLALKQAEQLAQQLANNSNGNTNRIRRSDLPRSERGRITP